MNGILWRVCYVSPDSLYLIDRTNTPRVATTDPHTFSIYLSNDLFGDFLRTVLVHELGHCTMMSYGLLPAIHSFVSPDQWIEAEEWVCNFIADYGRRIFEASYHILGEDSWIFIPHYFDRLAA